MYVSLYRRPGLSRSEFLSRVGAVKEVDNLVEIAYKLLNDKDYLAPDKGHADENPWHTSFHGSEFPGDARYACGRHAIYRLLDVPRRPFTRRGRQMMDSGKDHEDRLVWAWYNAGMLLSKPPIMPDGTRQQTRWEDEPTWLTSTVDALLVKPRQDQPVVAEVKQTSQEVLESLRNLTMDPHEKYVRQVKCQIGLAHEYGTHDVLRCHNTGALSVYGRTAEEHLCPLHGGETCLEEQTLAPVDRGFLYYASRNDPEDTFEFMFEYDPDFMAQGRKRLEEWREAFENDALPATNFDNKRFSHPFGWFWTKTEYPCKWCDYGDICRDDHDVSKERNAPIKISESAAIDVAEKFRPNWTLDSVREAVYARWGLI